MTYGFVRNARYIGEHGRSRLVGFCSFCGKPITVFMWSGQARCQSCGNLISARGAKR